MADYVLKTQSKESRIQEILDTIDNSMFLSNEDKDTVEHVDLPWSKLWELINELANYGRTTN